MFCPLMTQARWAFFNLKKTPQQRTISKILVNFDVSVPHDAKRKKKLAFTCTLLETILAAWIQKLERKSTYVARAFIPDQTCRCQLNDRRNHVGSIYLRRVTFTFHDTTWTALSRLAWKCYFSGS